MQSTFETTSRFYSFGPFCLDAARLLPLLDTHDFTFLIEDPATVWNLGPQRYPEIAKRYQPLTPHAANVVNSAAFISPIADLSPALTTP